MKIYGSMCIKNESDIILATIKHVMTWCDILFLIDNNSSDSTVDIIRNLMHQYPGRIVFFGSVEMKFQEGLKSLPLNYCLYSGEYDNPDWWAVLDADEIYAEDPRIFLNDIPKYYGRIATNTVEFIGLKKNSEPLNPLSYYEYIPIEWSETRFFRVTKRLKWYNFRLNTPQDARAVYPSRIKMYHFPYRTPQQIDKRIKSRKNDVDEGHYWDVAKSNYPNASAALQEYRRDERKLVSDGIHFSSSAINFYSSYMHVIAKYVMIFLYFLGKR